MQDTKGKKEKVSNIHDSFVKHNFSTKEAMIAFLKWHLDKKLLEKLDVDTVEMEHVEFVPNRYRNRRHADIILSVKRKRGERIYLLVLLEAQSKHDKYMAARILEYHAAIAFAHIRRGNQKVLLILTFVLYHGEKRWISPQSIADLFDNFEDYVELSLKSIFLVQFQPDNIEKLAKQGEAAFPLMALTLQPSGGYCENLARLYLLMKAHGQDDEQNIHYMASQNKHAAEAFFKKLSNFEAENVKKYKYMYRLLSLKQIRKAKKQGREEGKKVLLKKLLEEKVNVALLAEVAGLTPEALQAL